MRFFFKCVHITHHTNNQNKRGCRKGIPKTCSSVRECVCTSACVCARARPPPPPHLHKGPASAEEPGMYLHKGPLKR